VWGGHQPGRVSRPCRDLGLSTLRLCFLSVSVSLFNLSSFIICLVLCSLCIPHSSDVVCTLGPSVHCIHAVASYVAWQFVARGLTAIWLATRGPLSFYVYCSFRSLFQFPVTSSVVVLPLLFVLSVHLFICSSVVCPTSYVSTLKPSGHM